MWTHQLPGQIGKAVKVLLTSRALGHIVGVPFTKLCALNIDMSHCMLAPCDDRRIMEFISPSIWSMRSLIIKKSDGMELYSDSDSDDETGSKTCSSGDPVLTELSAVLKTGNALEVFGLVYPNGVPGEINAQNVRQLTEGLRPHVNLRSLTFHIHKASYSTASVAFLLSSLPVSSLTTLDLGLGPCKAALVTAISSLLCHADSRLRTLKLHMRGSDSVTDLFKSISVSRLRELDLTLSGNWKPPPDFNLAVPPTLRMLSMQALFLTPAFHEQQAANLCNWIVGE
eukprot:TRINITY_DN67014_c8_g2_i2.p1 TRINITY_DN67014_c8_g2~~TRINITY_DN67014_c8_g2_i2.p1  ORF type:complete len:284 (-),score=8.81 TRINITY_DN67014_c8_g2_i2:110-961(-)